LSVKHIVEDNDGSFYITTYNNNTSGTLPDIIKFSASGDLIWYRGFAYGASSYPFGLDIHNNEIRLFGRSTTTVPNTNITTGVLSIINLNKITGDTINTKHFIHPMPILFNDRWLPMQGSQKKQTAIYLYTVPRLVIILIQVRLALFIME
jgi:hypothetical protein